MGQPCIKEMIWRNKQPSFVLETGIVNQLFFEEAGNNTLNRPPRSSTSIDTGTKPVVRTSSDYRSGTKAVTREENNNIKVIEVDKDTAMIQLDDPFDKVRFCINGVFVRIT